MIFSFLKYQILQTNKNTQLAQGRFFFFLSKLSVRRAHAIFLFTQPAFQETSVVRMLMAKVCGSKSSLLQKGCYRILLEDVSKTFGLQLGSIISSWSQILDEMLFKDLRNHNYEPNNKLYHQFLYEGFRDTENVKNVFSLELCQQIQVIPDICVIEIPTYERIHTFYGYFPSSN